MKRVRIAQGDAQGRKKLLHGPSTDTTLDMTGLCGFVFVPASITVRPVHQSPTRRIILSLVFKQWITLPGELRS